MPGIREYPNGGNLLSTDALVIDRQGLGTFYIDGSGIVGGENTIANIAALRANTASGNSILYVEGYFTPNDGGEGNFYLNPTDTTTADNGGTIIVDAAGHRWFRAYSGEVNLLWWGVDTTGVAPAGAAWQSALSFCNAQAFAAVGQGFAGSTATLFVPSGQYNINAGATLSTCNVHVRGEGRESVRFNITAGQFLVSITGSVIQMTWEEFSTSNGAGFLQHTFTGVNDHGKFIFRNLTCTDYTVLGAGSLSSDMPYWILEDCFFQGSTAYTSIGFALAGDNSDTVLSRCSFRDNLYSLKFAKSGLNIQLHGCDLLRANPAGKPTWGLWLVPDPSFTNAGDGMTIIACKLGNENLRSDDNHILIADTDTSSGTFLTQHHLTTPSAGVSQGVTMRDNYVSGGSPQTKGVIYSYTANVRSWNIDDLYTGGSFAYIFQFDASVTFGDDYTAQTNKISLDRFILPFNSGFPPNPVSNQPQLFLLQDSFTLNGGRLFHRSQFESGFDAAMTPLDFTPGMPINGMTLSGGSTRDPATDAMGAPNAATVTFTTSADFIFGRGSTATPGRMAWVELDLQQSASLPLTGVLVQLVGTVSGVIAFQRYWSAPPNGLWLTIADSFIPVVAEAYNYVIRPFGLAAGIATSVMIGRAHFYHAGERIHPGAQCKQASAAATVGSLATLTSAQFTVTVPTIDFSDLVIVSSKPSTGLMLSAQVTAGNTVTVTIFNQTGATQTPGAITLFVRSYRYEI